MSPSCCNKSSHEAQHSTLTEILLLFGDKCIESAPWLFVGLISTVLLQKIKFQTSSIQSYLTFNSSTQPTLFNLFTLTFFASILGLATPLCSCGAIPMAIGLSAAGSSPAAVVSFLTAAQSAGLDSAAITYGMLGWETATFRLIGAIVLSVGAGMAVGRVNNNKDGVLNNDNNNDNSSKKQYDDDGDDDDDDNNGDEGLLMKILSFTSSLIRSGYKLIDEIWFVLAVGIFISVVVENQYGSNAFISNKSNQPITQEEYIPQPDWWDVEEDGPYPDRPISLTTSMFTVLMQDIVTRSTIVVGALPFQLCEHGVVSFAAALQKSGATKGTAHAFLLVAPATNIATLGAVLKTSNGDRYAPLRSAVAISFLALLISYVLDYGLVSWEGDTNIGNAIETIVLPEWWRLISVWICFSLIAWSMKNWLISKITTATCCSKKVTTASKQIKED